MISTYSQICGVVFGPGAIEKTAEKVKEQGNKALCICGKSVKAAGIADRVLKILKDGGVEAVLYDGVKADPSDQIVDEAAESGRKYGADVVVGIGGGSSLDAAKAVAVLLKNPGKISEYYVGKKPFTETAPLILLPTTSGTGSEVTPMAVITDSGNGIKQTVLNHAAAAIVDPELTLTAPPHVTAATGMDALSHAIEAYTANPGFSNPFSDVLALKAMEEISENLQTAYEDGSNLEARTGLSLGSNFAGMAFSESCVHFGHAAAHEIGARFHISHGALCALALPEVIEFSADVMPERIQDIAKAVGAEIPEGTPEETGHALAEVIRGRMRKLGIKALRDYGISREQAVGCAEGAVENNWFVAASPKKVEVEVMKVLIGKMYDNY